MTDLSVFIEKPALAGFLFCWFKKMFKVYTNKSQSGRLISTPAGLQQGIQ
jgi:hypothetical protein